MFPLARRYGCVPVTAQDVISPGASTVTLVEELARRASTAVLDVGDRNTATEARLALSIWALAQPLHHIRFDQEEPDNRC